MGQTIVGIYGLVSASRGYWQKTQESYGVVTTTTSLALAEVVRAPFIYEVIESFPHALPHIPTDSQTK